MMCMFGPIDLLTCYDDRSKTIIQIIRSYNE